MNVLVLGGDGFLGSHLVDRAVGLGHQVTVFDRFPYGVSKNLEQQRGRIRILTGEFANRQEIAEALKNQDIVYHFICATTPTSSWNDPFVEIDENLRTSLQLFELAASSGVRKIVYPSSGGTIYGPVRNRVDENALPNPHSPYGICKLTAEYFLSYFRQRTGIATDIYRIGNAYGPRQPINASQGVIAVWMGKILEDAEFEVYGDHHTLRDYVYVEDIAFLMSHSMNDTSSSHLFNLGTGRGVSIIELLEIFKTSIPRSFSYRILPRRQSDNASIILDSANLTTFFPQFTFKRLKDKIPETWEYFERQYRSHRPLESLRGFLHSGKIER